MDDGEYPEDGCAQCLPRGEIGLRTGGRAARAWYGSGVARRRRITVRPQAHVLRAAANDQTHRQRRGQKEQADSQHRCAEAVVFEAEGQHVDEEAAEVYAAHCGSQGQ